MTNTEELSFPNKSHRKRVLLPTPSVNLAEFFGIMIGDGGINNPWQANITLNSIKDKRYSEYISDLCKNLFNIYPAIRKRKGTNTMVISLASTTLVDFLVYMGLRRGNKLKQGLGIPAWIMKVPTFKRACLRGLIDTDGCMFIHKHNFSNKKFQSIGLCFTSASEKLLGQVMEILSGLKISGHISTRKKDVFLYNKADIARYMRLIGSSNERIISVYKRWRGRIVV